MSRSGDEPGKKRRKPVGRAVTNTGKNRAHDELIQRKEMTPSASVWGEKEKWDFKGEDFVMTLERLKRPRKKVPSQETREKGGSSNSTTTKNGNPRGNPEGG